jgi:hypothetical protein
MTGYLSRTGWSAQKYKKLVNIALNSSKQLTSLCTPGCFDVAVKKRFHHHNKSEVSRITLLPADLSTEVWQHNHNKHISARR